MKKSSADLFEEHRESVLNLLASGIESYHRQRDALDKALPDRAPDNEPQEGDFLNDFLHLNVQYLNQLARLGSSYSIVAARTLERLYEWCQPPDRIESGPAPPRLEGAAHDQLTHVVPITNELGRRATFDVTCSRFASAEHELDLHPRFDPDEIRHPVHGSRRALLDMEADDSFNARLTVTIRPEMKLRTDYRAKVTIRPRGGGAATTHVVVVRRVGK